MGSFLLKFIKTLSYLPVSFYKGLSKFLAFILNHIFRYRSNVVIRNLKRSFPKKSRKEISAIKKNFYLNLTDVFTEIIYTQSYTTEKVKKKYRIFNQKVIENLFERHNDIILVAAHTCNWEVGLSVLPLFLENKVYAIYKPLSNKLSEHVINKIRQRFGVELITKKESTKFILGNQNQKNLYVFIADQTPFPENAIWLNFLNQPTPVYRGAEVMAKKLNCPVVYVYNRKLKRGKYEIGFEVLTESPNSLPPEEITKLHLAQLEKEIINAPASWLWSHKRWKHKAPKNIDVN